MRPSGTRAPMRLAFSSPAVAKAVIFDWKGPGAKALTVIRRSANSIASVLVSP